MWTISWPYFRPAPLWAWIVAFLNYNKKVMSHWNSDRCHLSLNFFVSTSIFWIIHHEKALHEDWSGHEAIRFGFDKQLFPSFSIQNVSCFLFVGFKNENWESEKTTKSVLHLWVQIQKLFKIVVTVRCIWEPTTHRKWVFYYCCDR